MLASLTLLDPFFLYGLIGAFFVGWASSSYASNFAYRLPRGESPFGRTPYCGDCDSELKPKDLFPIFSWLATAGKCRYCGAKVPTLYFLLELWYSLFTVWLFVEYGFGDVFILLASLGMVLQIQLIMAWEDGYHSPLMTGLVAAGGLIYQLLNGQMLVDGLMAMFLLMMAAVAVNALLTRQPPDKQPAHWPASIWLLAASGGWLLSMVDMGVFLTVLLGGMGALWLAKKPHSLLIAHAAALIAVVMLH